MHTTFWWISSSRVDQHRGKKKNVVSRTLTWNRREKKEEWERLNSKKRRKFQRNNGIGPNNGLNREKREATRGGHTGCTDPLFDAFATFVSSREAMARQVRLGPRNCARHVIFYRRHYQAPFSSLNGASLWDAGHQRDEALGLITRYNKMRQKAS